MQLSLSLCHAVYVKTTLIKVFKYVPKILNRIQVSKISKVLKYYLKLFSVLENGLLRV